MQNITLIEEVKELTEKKAYDFVIIESEHTQNHEQHIMLLEHQIETQQSAIEHLQNNVNKYQQMFTDVTEHLGQTERLLDEQKQLLEEANIKVRRIL